MIVGIGSISFIFSKVRFRRYFGYYSLVIHVCYLLLSIWLGKNLHSEHSLYPDGGDWVSFFIGVPVYGLLLGGAYPLFRRKWKRKK
ncbi:hypothetical protein GCM10023228_11630 [Brevibacillus fulvus]